MKFADVSSHQQSEIERLTAALAELSAQKTESLNPPLENTLADRTRSTEEFKHERNEELDNGSYVKVEKVDAAVQYR